MSRVSWLSGASLPLISDIHGDIDALLCVLNELRGMGVDRPPLVLGDLFWTGNKARNPRAVLRHLMSMSCRAVIRGNTEERLLSGKLERWAPATEHDVLQKQLMLGFLASLSSEEAQWIRSLSSAYQFRFAGRNCLATHASPADIERGLVLNADKEQLQKLLAATPEQVIITGHLHRGFTHLTPDITHICVGAIGRHESDYDGIIDYAILDETASGLAVLYQRTRIENRDTAT